MDSPCVGVSRPLIFFVVGAGRLAGISWWFYNTWFHCSLLPAAAPKEDRPLLHSLYPSLVFSPNLLPRTATPSDPLLVLVQAMEEEEPVRCLRLALLTFPNYFYHGLWSMEEFVLSLLPWALVKPSSLLPRLLGDPCVYSLYFLSAYHIRFVLN
jgi:hypothetical protein